MITPELQPLFDLALAARANAHAPYSGCKIGAAIRLANDHLYAGCNVENASYGATICAERAAIFTAVAQEGAMEVVEVLVISDASPPWPPCGMCRQVMAEFAQNCMVHCVNLRGEIVSRAFEALFPGAFGAEYLERQPNPRPLP